MHKFGQLIIGSVLMGMGIAIAMKAGFGVDPMALFWEGIHIQSTLSLGMANLLVSSVLVMIIFFIDKRQLGLGTILNSLVVSFVIDACLRLPISSDIMIVRFLLFGIGLVFLSFGIAYYGCAQLGRGAFDGFVFGVVHRFKLSIRLVRTTCDLCLLGMGLLLQAPLRIGPFVSMLVLGGLIQFFYTRLTQNHEKA